MNSAELIDKIAERLEQTRKEATDTVEAVLDEIKNAVNKGDKVSLSGFGIFDRKKKKSSKGPRFKPASDFKALVSGARKASAPPPASEKKPSTPAQKSAPATAKRTAAKKTAAKKTAAKKTSAKKSATGTAKKATATAKKATAPARKASATARKSAAGTAKKAPAKKATTTAKKAPAKKTPATKAAAQK